MKIIIIIILLLFVANIVTSQNNTNNRTGKKVLVLNTNKVYPNKSFGRKKTITYIPLETSKDILLGRGAHIYYLSEKRMLIVNKEMGDVFIFGIDGNIISHFNQKGGLGYNFLSYAVYDELSNEVYILDTISRKIFVFTEDGKLKRTLKYIPSLYLTEAYNFDDESLLVYHKHEYGDIKQKQPYMFLSKKDGGIISKLNINLEEVNPTTIVTDKGWFSVKASSGNCKFGEEFIIANMSSDTIYQLKQDKTLTPLFVQSPGVFSEPYLITKVGMKTDDFIVFGITPNTLKDSYKKAQGDKNYKGTVILTKNIVYEFKTGIFSNWKDWKESVVDVDISNNMSVRFIQPYRLKRYLEEGKLSGELKKIAKSIDVSDNPVVQITKFQ